MKTNPSYAADIVLINGIVYTVDAERRITEALVVTGNQIVFTGRSIDSKAWIGPKTRVINLQGKMVLPGFIDSHCHITSGVCEIYEPILHGINTIEEYQQAILDYSSLKPELPGIQAGGWTNALFGPHGPGKELLDAVVPDRPVLLYSEDYHTAWVNSKTLEIAGITADTPNPTGGIIEHSPDGNPSGTLRETAVELVKRSIPPYSIQQVKEGLAFFQKKAHSLGITTVFNPMVSLKELTDLHAFHDWERSGEMRLRVPSGVEIHPEDPIEIIDELITLRDKEEGKYFKILAAKIFMDGVIEGATAYLEESYAHIPGSKGILNWDPAKFKKMCVALDKAGFQIHVHSIGDAATRITLDGFSEARLMNGRRDSRHSITHLQLVNLSDIDRFASLGVIAIPQPYWFVMDANFDQAIGYIGLERAQRQYPMKSFFEKGVIAASASDYNVTLHPNPLVAIETGITRRIPGEKRTKTTSNSVGVLGPNECVSIKEMIDSFTIHGAYAAFLEKETGSLEVGKSADFIILDKNIITDRPADIHKARVLNTFFDGRQVYPIDSVFDRG